MKALMKDRRQSNEGACDLDLQSTYSMTTSILLTHHRSINLTKEGETARERKSFGCLRLILVPSSILLGGNHENGDCITIWG